MIGVYILNPQGKSWLIDWQKGKAFVPWWGIKQYNLLDCGIAEAATLFAEIFPLEVGGG